MSTEIMAPRKNKRSNTSRTIAQAIIKPYASKTVKPTYGDIMIDIPHDREGSSNPQVIPKRSRDVSGTEDKVLSMYAKGMSQGSIPKFV